MLNPDKPLGFSLFSINTKDFPDILVYECYGFRAGEAPGSPPIYRECLAEGFEILPTPDSIIMFDDYDYSNVNDGKPFLTLPYQGDVWLRPKKWVRRWPRNPPEGFEPADVVDEFGHWKYVNTDELIVCISQWHFEE